MEGKKMEESARLIAQQAAGSQSILWEWVNKQRVINAFIQRGEMFCMAWFMELSRLSNSLGSVCSQRRGRLAAVALRSRLPCSLEPPLKSNTLPALERAHMTHEAELSRALPLLKLAWRPRGCHACSTVLCQQDSGCQLLLSLPLEPKPEEGEPGEAAWEVSSCSPRL